MPDDDVRERIARAIEAEADALDRKLERYEDDPVNYLDDDPSRADAQVAAYREAARIARETPAWVAVADRLPAEGADVLALTSGPERFVAYREDAAGWAVSFNGAEVEEGYVTHWMPIPGRPDHADS